jgi:hypothetical protein
LFSGEVPPNKKFFLRVLGASAVKILFWTGMISETIDLPEIVDREGIKMIAIKKLRNRFSDYPLKVVYEKRENELFIIKIASENPFLWTGMKDASAESRKKQTRC